MVNPVPALSQTLVKTEPDGSQTYYVYGLGLVSEHGTNGYRTYHYDLRGSTVALSDEQGAVVERFVYSPFCGLVSGDISATPFLYNGHDGVITDANGLYHMRARFYSPELRWFVNQDVLLGFVAEAQTLNRYAYVTGNTVSYIDPFGLEKRDPNSTYCKNLAKRIRNLEKELEKRYEEYATDPQLLPERIGPGEALRDTRRGHRTKINETDSRLNKNLNKYYDECGDPPPPGVPVDIKQPQNNVPACAVNNDNCQIAAQIVATAGFAYVTYRCVRMLPSLLPPFWATIPINAATP